MMTKQPNSKRHYLDGPFGQLHIHEWGQPNDLPSMLCLAPSPFSGAAYNTIGPLLAQHRHVIAIDYPGYGNSDSTPTPPSIADYAHAVNAVAKVNSADKKVDLLGFHTGCLVAVETALTYPDRVNTLNLIDVPFFSPEKQAELLVSMGADVELKPELSMLESAWNFCVAKRLEHIALPRAYEMFVDHIRAGTKSNYAFNAAFQYPCEQKFAEVQHATFVVATKAGLYEPSLLTAQTIAGAKLTELPEISTAVLEQGAPIIAGVIAELHT